MTSIDEDSIKNKKLNVGVVVKFHVIRHSGVIDSLTIRTHKLSIAAKLGLPPPDQQSQDWECEVCDLKSPRDWLEDYCRTDLTDCEKTILMAIIVEAMSCVLSLETVKTEEAIRLKRLILDDYPLHKELMDNWANWDASEDEEGYPITPVIRDFVLSAESKC